MANFIQSPNMSLPIPSVNNDPGPDWANNVNAGLIILDQHSHVAGSGVPITPPAININANLTFNNNAAFNLGYVDISPQGTGVPLPVNTSLYVSGLDLFYKNGSGTAVQITLGGNVNATSSGITSGTASAAFVSSVLTVLQNVGVTAPIEAASYILHYNGSYPTPVGNGIVLAASSSLSSSYQLTFPATAPGANNSAMVVNTSGIISYLTPDGIGSAMTATGANAIATTMTATGANTVANTRTRATGLTVAAGGVAISNANTTSSTTSTTPVDVSNLSVTITTTGRPVVITMISAEIINGAGLQTSVQGTESFATFYAVRNGTTIAKHQLTLFAQADPGTLDVFLSVPSSSFFHVDPVAAGTYTYKIQMSSGAGASASVLNSKLVVYEL